MRRTLIAAVVIGIIATSSPSFSQRITTQEDYIASDKAELKALAEQAHGDVYSLPHEKKIRVASIILKYFIRENFIDPDSVQAIITNDPHHEDLRVWQGLFGGGNKTYSGMAICARINGRNRLGGYVGDKQYLVIVMETGAYKYFESPYFNSITQTNEPNRYVEADCGR